MMLLKTFHESLSAGNLCPPLPPSSAASDAAASEVGVTRLVTILHRDYVGLRSPTQTLRSNILQLLGRIAEYFPNETTSKVSNLIESNKFPNCPFQASLLLPLFQTTLDSQLKSQKPDLLLYAGMIIGTLVDLHF
jgi:hypothetical protein